MSQNNINQLIDHIHLSTKWVKAHLKGERSGELYDKLVYTRRRFKKIEFASRKNPAAAVYGESQVGKSYLIKNLLSVLGEEFNLTNPSTGKKHDFLKEINPKGDGVEATSLVSRFSVNTEIINEEYPIKIQLLKPKDILLILIDSCLHELKDSLVFLRRHDIDKALEEINHRYRLIDHYQAHLSEDDVYDIRDYIQEYFPNSLINSTLKDSNFWKIVPEIIHQVQYRDWYKIFGLIWGQNEDLNKIFNRLIEELSKLDFSEYAYLKIDAVLRDYGTLIDVRRLHELVSDKELGKDALNKYISEAEVLIEGEEQKKCVIDKKYLCALTGEIIFKLDESLIDSKPFLKHIDLLDFPGARSRPNLTLDAIKKDVSNIILRGKVGYIFNKYSDQYLINYLLFCNRSLQVETTGLPQLLNNWISKYIGRNAAERDEFLSAMTVDPLFVIFTWFNTDLRYDSTNDRDKKSLNQKWDKRFNKIFLRDIVSENFSWHIDWSKSNPNFSNFYLLRDMRLSEELSNLFKGYIQSGKETEQINAADYPAYWDDLKSSFVNFPFVKKHFKDPELSWEESATMNKDGSGLIITNLNRAAETNTRAHKFELEVRRLWNSYYKELERYYHSDEADQRIINAINKARQLNLSLDISIGRDPYFFGKLLSKLLLNQEEVNSLFLKLLNDPEFVKEIDRSVFAPILIQNPDLSMNSTFDENVEVLRKNYGHSTREETVQFFQEQNIDLNDLFYGQAKLMLNRSDYLSEKLIEYWLENRMNKEKFQPLIETGFPASALSEILSVYNVTINQLKLKEKVARRIRDHVDGFQNIQTLIDMVADISTETINKFVNTIGIYYRDAQELEHIKKTSAENQLAIAFNSEMNDYKSMDEDALADLFSIMENMEDVINNPDSRLDAIKNIPIYGNYAKWINMMKIAFVATCDIPTYDVQANKKLEEILKEGKEISVT